MHGETVAAKSSGNEVAADLSDPVGGVQETKGPKFLAVLHGGIHTDVDFAKLMSAIMTDTLTEAISPTVASAAINAGGKILKANELKIKYGTNNTETQSKVLLLVQ